MEFGLVLSFIEVNRFLELFITLEICPVYLLRWWINDACQHASLSLPIRFRLIDNITEPPLFSGYSIAAQMLNKYLPLGCRCLNDIIIEKKLFSDLISTLVGVPIPIIAYMQGYWPGSCNNDETNQTFSTFNISCKLVSTDLCSALTFDHNQNFEWSFENQKANVPSMEMTIFVKMIIEHGIFGERS